MLQICRLCAKKRHVPIQAYCIRLRQLMRHYFLVGLPDVETFITNYKLIKYDLWLSSFIILREKRSNDVCVGMFRSQSRQKQTYSFNYYDSYYKLTLDQCIFSYLKSLQQRLIKQKANYCKVQSKYCTYVVAMHAAIL